MVAPMPSSESAAMSVVFFPRLRGTLPVARSPLGARAKKGVRAIFEHHSSTKTNCCAGSGLTAALQVARSSSLRSEAPSVFFCASNRRGEWHDSSSCDPPTCHACFPRAGSGLAACYRGRLAVGRPDQLPGPHISWMDVPEWLWERDLPFLFVVSGSA